MRFIQRAVALSVTIGLVGGAAMANEKIVFVRHGEKPCDGLGQLAPEGLDRALKLPGVMARNFYPEDSSPKPFAIFAPNPSLQKDDEGKKYDYVRPLATIEPTAIALHKPVNTQIGFDDTKGLVSALTDPANHDQLILVAWEHKIIMDIARQLLSEHGGDPGDVPKWHGDDFDSIYVVTIDWSAPKATATFEKKAESLKEQPETCPP